MGKRVVITKQNIKNSDYLITALFDDNRMIEVSCENVKEDTLLGNIYIGKIKRILEKIGAAFVEIAPGKITYLSLYEIKDALMVRQCRPGKLIEGDELVVQVVKEAVKTKDPTVSTNISFKGNALILTSENKILGISKKLDSIQRSHFQELFAARKKEDFGLVVRTNAKNCSDEQILAEFQMLLEHFEYLKKQCRHRTCYSCLYQSPPGYISGVRDHLSMEPEKIVTDDPKIHEALCQAFEKEASVTKEQIVLYEDHMLSLSALYGLKSKLEAALKEQVHLKSGAYLVIQPTEALTVIDVNSGKCIKGKQKDFYLKINLEAAKEIARQLRLRNISGICLVDFINMDTKEAREELSEALKQYLAKDSVPAMFVDFTELGLAEITRKKVRKPLWEQLAETKKEMGDRT